MGIVLSRRNLLAVTIVALGVSTARLVRATSAHARLLAVIPASDLFATGTALVTTSGLVRLSNLAAVLHEPCEEILGRVYSDSRGHAHANLRLTRLRAKHLARELAKVLPTKTIQVIGLGGCNPREDNSSLEGRDENRRVEILACPRRTNGGQ